VFGCAVERLQQQQHSMDGGEVGARSTPNATRSGSYGPTATDTHNRLTSVLIACRVAMTFVSRCVSYEKAVGATAQNGSPRCRCFAA